MTKATQQGRLLRLDVDGIEEPFLVSPLPGKRGKYLTEQFLKASIGKLTPVLAEQIFIEAIGPANFSRIGGDYVDVVTMTVTPAVVIGEDPTVEFSDAHLTFGPDGEIRGRDAQLADRLTAGDVLVYRPARDGEPPISGEPIRQEESEALSLAAFYWQTVVGMEAVNAFIAEGEGAAGSLKALSLLQIRLGLSPSTNSSSPVMESLIQQQAGSKGTPATPNSSATVRLPANKRSIGQSLMKPRKPRKSR